MAERGQGQSRGTGEVEGMMEDEVGLSIEDRLMGIETLLQTLTDVVAQQQKNITALVERLKRHEEAAQVSATGVRGGVDVEKELLGLRSKLNIHERNVHGMQPQ